MDKLNVWSSGVWGSDKERDIDDIVNHWLDTFDFEVVGIQYAVSFAESKQDMYHAAMITYKDNPNFKRK